MELLPKERATVERLRSDFDGSYSKIDRITRKTLLNLGFSSKLNGYTYICYAMRLILKNCDYLKNLTSKLYPTIAKVYSVKPHCVERSIRHSVDVAILSGKMRRLNQMIGVDVYDDDFKITNGELLSLFAESIKFEINSAKKKI